MQFWADWQCVSSPIISIHVWSSTGLSWVFLNNKLMTISTMTAKFKGKGFEIVLKRTLIKVKETVKINFLGFELSG